jgi:hypothetical protein
VIAGDRDAVAADASEAVAPRLLGAGMRRISQNPSEASLALQATGMRWTPTPLKL